ncbi:MAG: long-chain fatty acid--CoA ligase [Gammaproteobacteria bacterium]|nr:long-chain fatty acid--CoA ligase [Gammaproteobacteria bacterium]
MSGERTFDSFDSVGRVFQHRVDTNPEKVCIREKDFGIWNEYTWADWGEFAQLIGYGLKALGLERGDIVSIASEINKEWLFTDLATICMGGICNGVYPTDASNQVEYLIKDSGTKFYFAEDDEQLDKVLAIRDRTPTLLKIIVFDMEGLEELNDAMCLSIDEVYELGKAHRENHPTLWLEELRKAQLEDTMILTYTSGTTGPPKGAMITHRNVLFMMSCTQDCFRVVDKDRILGFLPLAHVAGRMLYTFLVIESRAIVHLVESLETVAHDIAEIEPTIHFAVPRVWEKQYSTVSIMIKEATRLGRWAYRVALQIGTKRARFLKNAQSVPMYLEILFQLLDFLVLGNVKRLLGINKSRWLATSAAPIAPELIEWYWSLGKPMYELYGQTECTGIATCNLENDYRIGSVGKAAKGVQVELTEDNEILIQSPGVIKGYWNQPEKTAETIRQNWLYSGDIGKVDSDGFVYVVDRINDIIITAGGKNITPSEIENQLKFSPYITDAVVVGDQRPYLTCLIMIDQENVMLYAQEHAIPFTNYTSLCHTSEVIELIGTEIERVNTKFARVETIKQFRLIDQLLDPEDEELTPTQKLKRKVVNKKYSALIQEMYS